MEDNFRNALIIISALVIAGIFIHGIWTIRKNKNPYKLKTDKTQVEPLSRDFDRTGFDQDGVSEVRVVTQTALTGEIDNPPAEEEIPDQPAPAPEHHEEPLPVDVAEPEAPMPELDTEPLNVEPEEPVVVAEEPLDPTMAPLTESVADSKVEPVIEPTLSTESEQSVYQEPVSQAKPSSSINAAKSKARAKSQTLKKNQFELNFDDEIIDDRQEPTLDADSDQGDSKEATLETEVIVVSVVMPEGYLISGASLLPSLLTLGMKFGDMNIFHRHEDNAGNGKVTFSLANMMNPGTFDLDNMENFTTQGVSLFMTLPNAGDPFKVFEQMLAGAKQLSQEFGGQILDDKRSVMTKQTEQHYVSKIREFERKKRIASA